jgi:hypothetical protein
MTNILDKRLIFFLGAHGAVRTRSTSRFPFYNRVPRGGFFFAGSLVEDPATDESASTKGRDPEKEIATNMAEVAEIVKAGKEEVRARAAKEELVKQGKYSSPKDLLQ